ncbi:MAG TPA: Smr/MutS family protein [Bdellovibrionota bacterium]|nr:Smr/MutS family protein [Bdellovibrionota bacterium]
MDAALSSLEWPRFVGLARERARSAVGKQYVDDALDPAEWAASPALARGLQNETKEILALLDREELWGPLRDLEDPRDFLEALDKGAVLELAQWVEVRRWLQAVDAWSSTPREELTGSTLLVRDIGDLPDPREPLRILERVLTASGEISERASPKLRELLAQVGELKIHIADALEKARQKYRDAGVLQEDYTDRREDRYVLAVKISSQSRVDGKIVETSVSQKTAFMEPREVEDLNRRLDQARNEYAQEVYRILEEMADAVRPHVEGLFEGVDILAYWDAVQARARLASHYGGRPLEVTEEPAVRLDGTAHPLLFWALAPEQIIRNDLEIGEGARMLLLSGPNTGGKTVLLKTLGLAALCARTGYAFPSAGRASVPFYDRVFMDMGDPQSIEQHLSSFSGHVLRFKEIIEGLTPHSLVLIDELNSATDPEEGAALGRAFVETLVERAEGMAQASAGPGDSRARLLLVATTHDPHLKALAMADTRVVNASMAFDEKRLSPTYRMVTGVPGRSRALETAERLGLPVEILKRARGYLSGQHAAFEAMVARLEADLAAASRARAEAECRQAEAEKLRDQWREKASQAMSESLEAAQKKIRQILAQAQEGVRDRVRALQSTGSHREIDEGRREINAQLTRALNQVGDAAREEVPELAETVDRSVGALADDGPSIQEGSAVRVAKFKTMGVVIELQGKKVKVAMGLPLTREKSRMCMLLDLKDVEALDPAEAARLPGGADLGKAPVKKNRPAAAHFEAADTVSTSLDLRGKRYEEAMVELEAYLDRAFTAGVREVTIIHGMGTGALKDGAWKLLKGLSYVGGYREGGPGQGGAGATVVQFDR